MKRPCAETDVEHGSGLELIDHRHVHVEIGAVGIERVVDPSQPGIVEDGVGHNGIMPLQRHAEPRFRHRGKALPRGSALHRARLLDGERSSAAGASDVVNVQLPFGSGADHLEAEGVVECAHWRVADSVAGADPFRLRVRLRGDAVPSGDSECSGDAIGH